MSVFVDDPTIVNVILGKFSHFDGGTVFEKLIQYTSSLRCYCDDEFNVSVAIGAAENE